MTFLLSHRPLAIALAAALFLAGCGGSKEEKFEPVPAENRNPAAGEKIPNPRREFRAAWVATVNNIDWPSAPGLPTGVQKREALAILDRLAELNFNAVILQVRPQADSIYPSKLEPWSYYLSGQQGVAPKPAYDPLAFWIKEAHERGLQLHAWFNPFRANHKAHGGPISKKSIVAQKPELVVKLGDQGYWWMDPSKKAARKHSIDIVMDVVTRYDIDGVHFDDYFYPYPSYNNDEDFPDQASYDAYRESGGKMSRGDWRRHAVNQFIHTVYSRIKAEKREVEFGISPFGIWRPNFPDGVAGMDPYELLHADARLWLNEGWVDYLAPQLYWPIDSEKQSFAALLGWWHQENRKRRHLWPGLKITEAGHPEGARELINQVMFTRGTLRQDDAGMCLFSAKWLMNRENPGAQALKNGPWAEKSLIPGTPWLDPSPPKPPVVELIGNGEGILLTRFKAACDNVFLYLLNERLGEQWLEPKIIPGKFGSFQVNENVTAVAVRAVDRSRNISDPVILEMTR